MELHITQKTAGWITAAVIACQSLCAQTGIRPAREFHEDTSLTITLQELRHAVPREAQAEMEKAYKAALRHQAEQEREHLEKAVLIDPEYVAARNNLGVCLMPIEPASAIAQLEEAIRVDPHKGLLYNNLAIAYVVIHNLEAAERAARMAMEIDRTTNRARGLLGFVLYQEHKYTAEASTLLERASEEYSTAHVFAAHVLLKRGDLQKARTHIQAYLSSGEMEYHEDASEMLDFIDHMGQTRDSWPEQF